MTFDLASLFESVAAAVRIPVFLVGLLVIRGLPALFCESDIRARRSVAAALLQATSLPFIVAAAQIGMELGSGLRGDCCRARRRGATVGVDLPARRVDGLRGGDRTEAQSDWPQEMVESMRSET